MSSDIANIASTSRLSQSLRRRRAHTRSVGLNGTYQVLRYFPCADAPCLDSSILQEANPSMSACLLGPTFHLDVAMPCCYESSLLRSAFPGYSAAIFPDEANQCHFYSARQARTDYASNRVLIWESRSPSSAIEYLLLCLSQLLHSACLSQSPSDFRVLQCADSFFRAGLSLWPPRIYIKMIRVSPKAGLALLDEIVDIVRGR